MPAPSRRPRTAVAGLLLFAATAAPAPARAWGSEAHRLVNQRAAETLPEPLRALFDGNVAFLRAHSVDPDLWRVHHADEGPNHFINLDAFDDLRSGEIPASEKAHLGRHGDTAAAEGRLPWRIGEVYRELVAAFRRRDAAQVLEKAAVLGHYVADAHAPLHSVVDYDGRQSGQDGVHGRWETGLFVRFQRQIEPLVAPGPAEIVSDPVPFTFGVLQDSRERAAPTLESDRRAAGDRDYVETAGDDRYDDAYYSRLYEREGARMVARLTAAAEAVGSLWLSAWSEAGRPGLDASFRFSSVRGESRLVVALLEGAGAQLVDEAAERGALPHLDALRSEGSVGRLRAPFPARAAATQATLWTGAWPEQHGVVGDGATRPSGSVLETTPGLSATALGAEPLWVSAAREGLSTVVVGVPQAAPFAPFLEARQFRGDFGDHLILLAPGPASVEAAALTAADLEPSAPTGWTGEPGPAAREVEIAVGGGTLPGLLFDDPGDPTTGLDTLALSAARDVGRAVLLKPVPAGRAEDASRSVGFTTPAGPASVHFRLFALSPDGRELLLWHSSDTRTLASRERVQTAALDDEGLLGSGAHRLYLAGALGDPLWEGGDGTAERRYLETLRLVARQHVRAAALVLERTHWSLAVLSLPLPAEPLRLWAGRLDPTLPGHDAALAVRLRPFLDESLRLADAWVGEIARRTPPDAALAVLGDRGLGGVRTVARPNVALEAAGLLRTAGDGSVDLTQTKVVYAPADGGFLVLNGEGRPGGIQPRRGESLARAAAIAAMQGMRTPGTGEPVIAELLEPGKRGAPAGIGGPSGGFLYLRPAAGVLLSPETRGPAVETIEPRGAAFDPDTRSSPALLVLNGRGVARGRSLDDVRSVDVAPTLARLLGLAPPAQAQGEPIERALSSDSR